MGSVNIIIKDAVKKYGDNTVIPDLNLDVKQGEFFTLLGPSGCGKTTLLRMIAGFNSIEGGDFYFNDVRINDLDPAKRNIGMVFQNYAIFPHLTVRGNVEFGLKNKNFPKGEIRAQADKFMELMQIDQFADRKPERLSGGQQQRVALARALCIEPDVLLMDEPLSNLDAKLRVEMRTVIKNIQRNVGITCIYVTHDQEEAMAISDRIAVMNAGVIQHVGTPKDIYQRPANIFVSTFIGRSNVLKGKLVAEGEKTYIETADSYRVEMTNVRADARRSQDIQLSIRPEEFLLNRDAQEGIAATIDDSVFLGLNTHYFAHLKTGEEIEIIQESSIDKIIEPGTDIRLTINTEKANIFDAEGEENLLEGVRNDNVPSDAA
ncbi:MAG: ABC transporter ATP-binding protein [Lachnospiraceae bacterium]|nr:ABC transporter ATP-binding protein [Lachnospiraceae bacterium]